MNIAIINQGGNRYLFEVPESISLKEGEKVKCDTKRGVTDGTVWADSITTDEPTAKLIGKLLGAKFPLKSVVGKIVTSVEMFEQPELKQEPVKLYCVEDWEGTFTAERIYEVVNETIRFDDGTVGYFPSDFQRAKKILPNLTSRLVPLASRPAKVGEWVYVLNKSDSTYEPNKIYKVFYVNRENSVYFAPNCRGVIKQNDYLVLDGYKPDPEKAEPEYLNMRVVCVAGSDGFTVGKVYEFKNGVVVDDDGDVRPSNGDQRITSLSDAYLRDWENKFIEFKGE